MPEMENPKTSRSTAKGKLTRIEKYVNDDTIEKNIHDLTIRLNLVENALKDFEKAQCGVESLPGIVLTDEEDERDSFERRYCDVVSKINSLIHKNQNKEQATTTSVRSVSNSNRDDSLNIQLPVYSLPTFSGCYKDWLSFSDQFKSVIHENDKLDSCKKFHYLRSCLKGEALKTVESLSVSNNNYQIAWDLLERRYANERLVAQEHVYAILKFPVIAKASHTHLRELIDMLNTNMEALKMLKVPVDSWDAIIVPIITEKLDFHSKREWQSKVDASIPKYKDFLLFLEKRHQTLESLFLTNKLVVTNVQPSKSKSNSYSSTSNNQSSNKSKFCNACKKPNHYTNQCITLLKLDLNERLKLIQQLKLCQNCFKDNHNAVNCKSNFKCKECDANHNTLIHGATGLESSTARPQSVSLNSYSRVNLIKSGILSTAIVLIKDKNNQFQECRAFLDGGSMNHFITSDMCKRLGLTRQKVRIEIGGINQSASSVNHAARVTIKSRHNQYSQELRCLVLDKITENLPVHIMDMSKIAVPENIKLADPRFDCSGPVDLLIGAELFLPLMCIGQIHLAPGQPHFQKTHLGWIVGGTLGELDNKTKTLCHFSQQKLDLHEQVEKFFSIESVNAVADKLSPEERECETHFCNTIKRDAQGRFIARLPFRSNPPDLGDSHAGAVKRFRSLESKLNRHPELKEQYSNFMTEYRQLNHMELLKDPTINFENSCYLPHHAVLKQSSSTTKLRAVFDASFITTNNKCLNDNLLGGPVIQDDLFSILIRFRTHRYVITADIEKMYRQILIDSVDTDYQRILWRDHPNEELKTYRLTTLTYGTKPASFIATRCLVELAVQNQNVNPLASAIIKRDFYMDDLLTGADTISELSTIPERRKQTIVAAEVMTIPLPVLTKISSFHKLNRIIAYCLRWLHNHRKSKQRQLGDSGAIKIHELQRAKITIIQLVQNQAFADDLKILRQNKALPNKSRLLTLSPFLSKNNLIRVGGRLRNASLKFDTKHPILLPNDHHVTKLIVEQAHVENLHSGAEGTLAALRQNYWIISPRSLIRQVIHRCNSCFRCNPKRVTQMMGDLPACRLESNRPFLISGVDYLGPILIKESTGRGKRNVKAYVSIFVCLVTKAVHLELVGNLTTESFLGALHRLIARRGHVRHLYSDNGSNFIGAANQETKKFKSFLKSSEFQSDVINKLTERNTEFHFIPARSPHMGGLWEINVKSVKNHIKRSIGLATPTFEEMYTLLTRIEAILNSRPLTPISNDPNDLEPLTPGHFLSPGESLTAVHEGDITEVKTNRLSRWQLVERMRQLFWRRWTREYLSRLQARSKWRNPDTTPAVGSLVLIADDELPPLRWNLARITELHLGKDGLPRVASLKTKNGATKRSVHKLCVLPLEREDVHVLTHYE
jgi:hypothetical protein